MARRKRNSVSNAMAGSSIGGKHFSTSIDEVDNGFIVNVSGEGKNGEYSSKRMIASDRPSALRIANEHLSGGARKGSKKKASNKKKIALKKG